MAHALKPGCQEIMNARYDALFLDAGQTLLEYVEPSEVGWANALSGLGGPSANALSAAFEDVLGERQARAAGLDAALLLRSADASPYSHTPTFRNLNEIFTLLS